MPEGHTIHRLANDLTRDLRGRPVAASSPQGRFADSAAMLHGDRLRAPRHTANSCSSIGRDGQVLAIHLGLIGKFRRRPVGHRAEPQTPSRLAADGRDDVLDLTGPMVCTLIDPAERALLVADIGPDPLRRERIGR